MKLDCFPVDGADVDIQPAAKRRQWMDDTPESYAYRCLPLTVANAHGWEIRCPVAFEAEWDGTAAKDAVRIFPDSIDPDVDGEQPPSDGVGFVEGRFGSGILTFNPMAILRTEPEVNLWVAGPPNTFKDGIQPMSAVIETDWMPYSFTMNWKFTRAHTRIRFEQGEPYCFFFPVPRGIVAACDPQMSSMEAEPGLEEMHRRAYLKRSFLAIVKGAAADQRPIKNEKALRFQGWYMEGVMPDGSEISQEHETSVEAKPFRIAE